MKREEKKIILKAMYFIIFHLEVNPSLLSILEQNEIFDVGTIQEIMVRRKQKK